MKYFIALLLAVFTFSGKAQDVKLPIDSSTGKVAFTEVVLLDSNYAANELFKRAKAWFVQTYNSSKDVIQDADQELHTITGKALMTVHMTVMGATNEWGHVKYMISLSCKDGKYKYVISDFYHENDPYVGLGILDNGKKSGGTSYREKDYYRVLAEVDAYAKSLILSIKEAMNKPSAMKSDW